jgi:hypothetical protein
VVAASGGGDIAPRRHWGHKAALPLRTWSHITRQVGTVASEGNQVWQPNEVCGEVRVFLNLLG